jgi:hypothetical protein
MNFNFYKTHSPVKSILLAGGFLLAMTAEASAQTIPSVQLKDLTGSTVDTGTLENEKKLELKSSQ